MACRKTRGGARRITLDPCYCNAFAARALTRVPRYFFHIHDSVDFIDQEGTEFPGLEEARGEAVVTAGEILREVDRKFWNRPEWRMWVTDDAGETVCAIKFSGEQP